MTIRIAITPGEPAGIGPDVAIELAQQEWPVQLIVCADPDLLIERAKQLQLPLTLQPYQPGQPAKPQQKGTLTIAPFYLKEPVECGVLNSNNGHYVLETLRYACEKISPENSALWSQAQYTKKLLIKQVLHSVGTPSTLQFTPALQTW